MAIVKVNLHNNCIVEAFIEHFIERVRNAYNGRLVRRRARDVNDHKQTDHMTSGGALSEAVAYWKDGSGA